jgi:hypothetical protein
MDLQRELRGLDEEGRQAMWERGLEALRELRIADHLKWMEPFLDGYYAERLPDGRTRWEHLNEDE